MMPPETYSQALSHLERRIARITREYGDEMSAKDVAFEEKCSPSTASRRMARFEFGALTIRNKRVIRCFRQGYIEYLRNKTTIQRLCA